MDIASTGLKCYLLRPIQQGVNEGDDHFQPEFDDIVRIEMLFTASNRATCQVKVFIIDFGIDDVLVVSSLLYENPSVFQRDW